MNARSLEDLERDAFLADAELLAQLVSHPAWPRYEELIAKMRAGSLELLAGARSQRMVSRCQGAAAILAELLERPHQIIVAAKGVLAEESSRKQETRSALDFASVPVEDDL